MRQAVILALALLVALGVTNYVIAQPRATCQYGRVQGFIAVRSEPPYLVGTIPSRFTSDTGYFQRRYNCTRGGVQIRRLDLGVYDVRFPGLERRVPFVSAISQEGVVVSVDPLFDGVYRIVLRGPIVRNDLLTLRDVPFSLSVY